MGFQGDEENMPYCAITASGPCVLSITDCVFDECGAFGDLPAIQILSKCHQIDLKLIGNAFTNLETPPIGGEDNMEIIKINNEAIIKNNTINGIKTNDSWKCGRGVCSAVSKAIKCCVCNDIATK